jgi:hypothetical protein
VFAPPVSSSHFSASQPTYSKSTEQSVEEGWYPLHHKSLQSHKLDTCCAFLVPGLALLLALQTQSVPASFARQAKSQDCWEALPCSSWFGFWEAFTRFFAAVRSLNSVPCSDSGWLVCLFAPGVRSENWFRCRMLRLGGALGRQRLSGRGIRRICRCPLSRPTCE